jgi:hypothetical protein|nr:MAG TPA: hypothetical protein [Bacteriophage sp.]
MITDEILERIFSREDVAKVPLIYQSTMIHAIEEVLDSDNTDTISDISEYDE